MGEQKCTVTSATILGVEAIPVAVEVALGPGLPGMFIVGLPDTAIQEAKERVKSALRAAGFSLPNARIVVNLAPGPLKKSGTGFDLPIALGLLVATGQVPTALIEDTLVVGELSLDGSVRGVSGTLAYMFTAQRLKYRLLCAASSGAKHVPEGLDCFGIESIRELTSGNLPRLEPLASAEEPLLSNLDFADVRGNEGAKRALLIAAAGFHGVLMIGPPGSGKSMLAKRVCSILPPLTEDEILESALVHSVAGLDTRILEEGVRPFRSPHHSSSVAGLIGGGTPPKPGEISLAHNGVLFLDEMPEFGPAALQALRQPMEDEEVTIVRADNTIRYPARFMLIGAANPCPCGYLGDPQKPCTCRPDQISRYHNRIGGPLMDRIDLVLHVGRVDPSVVLKGEDGLASAEMKEQVMIARERRFRRLSSQDLREEKVDELLHSIGRDPTLGGFFETLARTYHLSGRAISRLALVSRTIADLEGSCAILRSHLAEAIGYRVRGV